MFYIRADANGIIGAGHIMRCLAVAVELRKNLEEVVFIVADQYGQGIVESYGFKTLCLHSQWDNLEMELGIILPLVKENHVRGILVDSYYVTENYLAKLHQCTRVAYIDDVDAFIYPVDLLVNYNIYAEKMGYFKRYNDAGLDTEFLLGCSYVPLREEFYGIQINGKSDYNTILQENNKKRKVLITSGGSGLYNITGILLDRLKEKDWFNNTIFYVILGKFNQYRQELQEKWQVYKNVFLYENVNCISKYMSICDIAVTAGGSTVYELCACGLPPVMYTVADNQLGIANELASLGLVPWCGDARENIDKCIKKIVYYMEKLLWDDKLLKKTSIELQKLVDSCGAARIAKELLQRFFYINKILSLNGGGSIFMSTHITKNRILDFTVSLKIQHRSPNTITSYTTNIQKLELFLGGSELTKEQMLSYKQWLSLQGFKQRTINAYLAAANYFCDVMGWGEMKVTLDPVIEDNTVQNKKQISSANYKKLVYTAIQNNKERLAMMVQVLCHMDLRFCELERLTTESLEAGFVEVTRKNKQRKIKIPDILAKDLYTYIKHEHITSGVIFRTSKGSPVDRSNFRKDIKKLCILAGVEEELGSIQHVKHVVLDEYPYYNLKKWE